jgi:hypothetical protein
VDLVYPIRILDHQLLTQAAVAVDLIATTAQAAQAAQAAVAQAVVRLLVYVQPQFQVQPTEVAAAVDHLMAQAVQLLATEDQE